MKKKISKKLKSNDYTVLKKFENSNYNSKMISILF